MRRGVSDFPRLSPAFTFRSHSAAACPATMQPPRTPPRRCKPDRSPAAASAARAPPPRPRPPPTARHRCRGRNTRGARQQGRTLLPQGVGQCEAREGREWDRSRALLLRLCFPQWAKLDGQRSTGQHGVPPWIGRPCTFLGSRQMGISGLSPRFSSTLSKCLAKMSPHGYGSRVEPFLSFLSPPNTSSSSSSAHTFGPRRRFPLPVWRTKPRSPVCARSCTKPRHAPTICTASSSSATPASSRRSVAIMGGGLEACAKKS